MHDVADWIACASGSQEGHVIRTGIYAARYSGIAYEAQGVFVLRNGAFRGVGQAGAVYEGSYAIDFARGAVRFSGNVRFPAGTVLVTGERAGTEGLTAAFAGVGPPPAEGAHISLQLEGQPVNLVLNYVGPLPG